MSQNENLTLYDIELFRGKAWDLAKAVDEEDTLEIEKIIKKGDVDINYQEQKFGTTLLTWAVFNERYHSSKTLLKLGANPNLPDKEQITSLMYAADNRKTSDYLKLLLRYGGNPKIVSDYPKPVSPRSPLMAAAGSRLESVKILVDAGADINFVSPYESINSALKVALITKKADIVHYLLIEKNANFDYIAYTNINGIEIRIGDNLRDWAFPLDSKEYKLKMEIVEYLKKKGENYWERPIPIEVKKQFPKEYWESY